MVGHSFVKRLFLLQRFEQQDKLNRVASAANMRLTEASGFETHGRTFQMKLLIDQAAFFIKASGSIFHRTIHV